MKVEKWNYMGKTTKATLALITGVLCATVGAVVIAGHADNGSPNLSPAKQAVINRIAGEHPASGPREGTSDLAPVAPPTFAALPCTRDLTLLISGLVPDQTGDFVGWEFEYKFNDAWVDPNGTEAVRAGKVIDGNQGVVSVQRWSPATSCTSTHTEYRAPAGSGSMTITGVSGSTISMWSSDGSPWTFDLRTDSYAEVP